MTYVISVVAGHKQRCLIEKNVPIEFILPSRWQDGAEGLRIERPQKLSMSIPSQLQTILICFCLPAGNVL